VDFERMPLGEKKSWRLGSFERGGAGMVGLNDTRAMICEGLAKKSY
jgi:hypothetical protein